MYSTWSIKQLKDELKRRGASMQGRKADLIERLEAYDRNFNFGAIIGEENEDIPMQLPAPDTYHDVNSSTVLPLISKQHIKLYFSQFDKKPDDGLKLYESRFLMVLRASKSGDSDYTYIKGICRAAMKRLQYEINLKMHNNGTIEESACECVAGSGTTAHCKHVAMVLYAVEHVVKEKILLKYQTPTEKLQKFHKPTKSYTYSPVKSKDLPMRKRNIQNVIFSPCSMDVDVVEYNSKIRNLILNCPSKMPMKQLYEPANPYGIENDHDYCGSQIENLFSSLLLSQITIEQVTNIEMETRGQTNNSKWFKYRECRLTASKFHTICHLRHDSKEKYAKQLLNCVNTSKSAATTHGIINEKTALQEYAAKYDLNLHECGLFISSERPYLAASPDGLLGDETIIEIKCPYTSRNLKIDDVTVLYLTAGENGQLKLKSSSPYYFQVQGQLYCSGRKYCNFIVYTYKGIEVIYIERNDDFIRSMLEELDNFYIEFFKEAIVNKYLYKDYLNLIKKSLRFDIKKTSEM